jgi:hypothetical protein
MMETNTVTLSPRKRQPRSYIVRINICLGVASHKRGGE